MSRPLHLHLHHGLQAARLGVLCLLSVSLPLLAQSLRDPTVPPAAATPSAPGDAARGLTVESGTVAILVRDGVPYLMVGTRLYAKGQSVGRARIEHISEAAVWLREDGMLRKIPVFGGIERRTSAPKISINNSVGGAGKAVPKTP
jgi:hypothetical protein